MDFGRIKLGDWPEKPQRNSSKTTLSGARTNSSAATLFPHMRKKKPPFLLTIIGAATIPPIIVTVMMLVLSPSESKGAAEQPRVIVVEKSPAAAVRMVDVVVPVRNIPAEQILDSSMFIVTQRPESMVPKDAVHSLSEIMGRFSKSPLPPDVPIPGTLLAAAESLNQVARKIPPGYRAVTINVNATSGVEGWAKPGARVDIQWITDQLGNRIASMLVENAMVLSAERQVNPNSQIDKPIPTTVTLLTSDQDAQKISFAATSGQLVLHLRGTEDGASANSNATPLTLKDLLGSGASAAGVKRSNSSMLRVTNKDGSVEEFALVDGKLSKEDGGTR